jgi:hypothetical protein
LLARPEQTERPALWSREVLALAVLQALVLIRVPVPLDAARCHSPRAR